MSTSTQERLKTRALNEEEDRLIKQYNVRGLLEGLIERLKGSTVQYCLGTQVPLTRPGQWDPEPAALAAVDDDKELRQMGCNLSLVAPGIAIPVRYFQPSKGAHGIDRIRAWTPSTGLKGTMDDVEKALLTSKEEVDKKGLPAYVAFPRYLQSRTVQKEKLRRGAETSEMKSLSSNAGKAPYSISWPCGKGNNAVWTQLPPKGHPDSDDRFYDEGNPLLQIEYGMPTSPNETYWRLDIISKGKSSFSTLVRVVIVRDHESEEVRPWASTDGTTFPRLEHVLSDYALGRSKWQSDSSTAGANEPPVSVQPARPETLRRSRSPGREGSGLMVRTRSPHRRSRSSGPSNARRSGSPPTSYALSHRQHFVYGRRYAAGF